MKNKTKKKIYKRGDRPSFYIGKESSDNFLNWLNNQENLTVAVTSVLEKYANGELVNANVLRYVNINDVNSAKPSAIVENNSNTLKVEPDTNKLDDIKNNFQEEIPLKVVEELLSDENSSLFPDSNLNVQREPIGNSNQNNKEKEQLKNKPILFSTKPVFADENSVKSKFGEE